MGREDLGNCRRVQAGRHTVFYRPSAGPIRVLHDRMDAGRHLN